MSKPILILLTGFAGSGKTTLAKRYIDDHPLALDIEGDRLIVQLGQWQQHEDEARRIIFEHTKSTASTHLSLQKDVIITYLLTDTSHAEAFEQIAHVHDADYVEIALATDRDTSIKRLLQRGTWGEEGTDPLTEDDVPAIHALWDTMTREAAKRPHMIDIPVLEHDIEGTYRSLLGAIPSSNNS